MASSEVPGLAFLGMLVLTALVLILAMADVPEIIGLLFGGIAVLGAVVLVIQHPAVGAGLGIFVLAALAMVLSFRRTQEG